MSAFVVIINVARIQNARILLVRLNAHVLTDIQAKILVMMSMNVLMVLMDVRKVKSV